MSLSRIIDAHHHIWRREDLPWLVGPMQPRIFGPYEPIRRDYLIGEYRADVARANVYRSVYVQANWAKNRFLDEVDYVTGAHDETGWPHAIVAYADVTVEDARPQFDRLAKRKLVRGIRMQLHWHAKEEYRFAARSDLCTDPLVQKNVARLAEYGFVFDLQVFAPQMKMAAELVDACPGVTFVLQHAGMLEDVSPEGVAEWQAGMKLLAARPNVVAKLSGLGTFLRANESKFIALVVEETVKMFGAGRCLFGSNFPIEKLWTSYDNLINAYRAATRTMSDAEKQSIFHDTAAGIYRLG